MGDVNALDKPLAKLEAPFNTVGGAEDEKALRHGREVHVGFPIGRHIQGPPMFFTRDKWPAPFMDMYRGHSAFVVASGPSFLQIDREKLKEPGMLTLGLNNSVKTFRPNMWTCVDDPANFIMSTWLDPKIQKFVPISHIDKPLFDSTRWQMTDIKVGDCPNTWYYKRNERFNADQYLWEDSINWGNHTNLGGSRSVLLAAMRILFLLGIRKVYLLGVDMEMNDTNKYHFEQDRTKGSIKGNNSTYSALQDRFTLLRPKFEEVGFNVYNCLGAETEFITRDGVRSFKDCVEGERLEVLTHLGNWKKAIVTKGGTQRLRKLTFRRGGGEYVVRATESHRWLLSNGTETTQLAVGDVLRQPEYPLADWNFDNCDPVERLAWCYGYVYGDGTVIKKGGEPAYSAVRLCKPDREWLGRFEELGFGSSRPLSCGGDPMVYTGSYLKTLPDVHDDPRLLRAFVHGWLDADAAKQYQKINRFRSLQVTGDQQVDFVRRVFPVVGAFVTNELDFTGQETNYGIRTKATIRFGLTIASGDCTKRSFHVLKSIEDDRDEDVWCLEVEDDRSFTLANGIVTGNCNPTSKLTAFDHVPFEEAYKAARHPLFPDTATERTAGLYDRKDKEKKAAMENVANVNPGLLGGVPSKPPATPGAKSAPGCTNCSRQLEEIKRQVGIARTMLDEAKKHSKVQKDLKESKDVRFDPMKLADLTRVEEEKRKSFRRLLAIRDAMLGGK